MQTKSGEVSLSLLASAFSNSKNVEEFDASPDPRIKEMLHNSTLTFHQAIFEFLDNSLEKFVGATKIWVNKVGDKLTISDNGAGFSNLKNSTRYGARNSEYSPENLGYYSCGLKQAIAKLGFKAYIISKTEKNGLEAIHYEVIRKDNSFKIDVLKNVPSAINEEFNLYTENAKTGTVIVIYKLRNFIGKSSDDQWLGFLRNKVTETYRNFLNDATIKIGKDIAGSTKYWPSTSIYYYDDLNKPPLFAIGKENHPVFYDFYDEDTNINHKVGFILALMPEALDTSSYLIPVSKSNQGLSIMRNNRQIIKNKWLYSDTHPEQNRIRGEVFITQKEDNVFGIPYTKNIIYEPDELPDFIFEKAKEILGPARKFLHDIIIKERIERQEKSGLTAEQTKDFEDIIRGFNSKQKRFGLAPHKPSDRKQPVVIMNDEPSEKKPREYKPPQGGHHHSRKTLAINTLRFGLNDRFWDYEYFGNGVIQLIFNIAHRWYPIFMNYSKNIKQDFIAEYFTTARMEIDMEWDKKRGIEKDITYYKTLKGKRYAKLLFGTNETTNSDFGLATEDTEEMYTSYEDENLKTSIKNLASKFQKSKT